MSGAEVVGVVLCILLIGAGSVFVVCQLQRHMQRTRRKLDPNDAPWARMSDVVYLLSALIAGSVLIGLYLFRVHADVWPSV